MPDVSLLQREYYAGGEEESRTPSIASTVALVLFLITLVAFGGFYFYNRSLITRAQTITENIKGLHVGDVAETIDQLKELGGKAKGLQELREGHTAVSDLLATFEKTTHPATTFLNADFDAKNNSVKLKGETETTKTMARQVEIYQQEGALSNFSVENIAYKGEAKTVEFQASITFTKK